MRFRRLARRLGVFFTSCVLLSAAQSDAERAGAKLFQRYCAACHGKDAAGGTKAPSLVTDRVTTASAEELGAILKNGSAKRGMPSFARLPEPQREQIIAWLKRK